MKFRSRGPGDGFVGVYSLSEKRPVRIANFPAQYEAFESAQTYADWKFLYVPPVEQDVRQQR